MGGQGTLLGTTLEASGFNVSAYTVKAADNTLNVMVINKETDQNLRLSINCGQAVHSAELMLMSGSALNATGAVTIQGSGIGTDGSFSPSPPYTAEVSGSVVTCFLSAISAVLIKVS
jgi:alpha-L-arabinofuranosidase